MIGDGCYLRCDGFQRRLDVDLLIFKRNFDVELRRSFLQQVTQFIETIQRGSAVQVAHSIHSFSNQ